MTIGVLVSLAAAGILLSGVFALSVEAWALAHGKPPITTFTRTAIIRWPGPAICIGAVVAFCTGLLFAHFFWDAYCG